MSWGIKITVLYVGFVLLISTMVFISASHKVDLVAKDYYAQELKYQERINAAENEQKLRISITHEVSKDNIVLHYPLNEMSKNFEGEVLFFRPSDSSLDLKMKLNFDSRGKQTISKTGLTKGVYKMCISWKNNNEMFYKEEVINI